MATLEKNRDFTVLGDYIITCIYDLRKVMAINARFEIIDVYKTNVIEDGEDTEIFVLCMHDEKIGKDIELTAYSTLALHIKAIEFFQEYIEG